MRKLWHKLLQHLRIIKILENQKQIIKLQRENLFAQRFNSSIQDCEWLKYMNFSPGGWAVDYSFLFVLFKILNYMRPASVIEFGLGQSSKMIHQYASFYKKNAVTIEHDETWADFFKKDKCGEYDVNIQLMDLEKINYKESETLTYSGIDDYCGNRKYDLVVIDGPFGSKHFSRPQLINIAKKNIPESFCIIIDDTNRAGEKETLSEVYSILDGINIKYHHRTYKSIKSFTIICSDDLHFLTTL